MRLLLAASRVAIRVGLFSAMLFNFNAHAQTDTPCPTGLAAETVCYSGKDGNGAFYMIAKPKNWNGMLVVNAHGGPNPFGDEKLSTMIPYFRWKSSLCIGRHWKKGALRTI